jgi:hypothetical protein
MHTTKTSSARVRLLAVLTALSLSAVGLFGLDILPANASNHARYYPSGPQLDVPLDQVLAAGWEICYDGSYSDSRIELYGPDGLLEDLCTGEHLMLGGALGVTSFSDGLVLDVLATAPREDVLADMGDSRNGTHISNGTGWYFSDSWSWGFVAEGDEPNRISCDVGRVLAPTTLCWHTDSGLMFEGYLLAGVEDVGNFNTGIDGYRVVLQATTVENLPLVSELQPVPYLGPVVTNDPETAQSGSTVTYTGSDLDEVTSATIAGQSAAIVSKSASSLTLRVPAGLNQGMHDVVLHYSTTESIILQNGLVVQDLMKVWTQLQSDNTVKMYAKNIVGEGKIQFFHNNNEIAWVKASNALNPKLRQSNGSSYLVRTRELVAGKNAFEIYQDGTRIWRAAYSN